MAKATITVQDVDGAINVAVEFDGDGFDKQSAAHQYVVQIATVMIPELEGDEDD